MTSSTVSSPSPPLNLAEFWRDHWDALAAATCGLLMLLGWSSEQLGWSGLELPLLAAAYIIGGYNSTREGLTTLITEKELDVDLLMILAALGAATLGLWQQDLTLILDGAVLILIFAISGALEGFTLQRTERNIRQLMSATPDIAEVIRGGTTHRVTVDQVQVGDVVLVKPGDLIPVDGEVIEGQSPVNQASITGESTPVDKALGDQVYAGSLNGQGVLQIRVNQPPESSLIQRVIRLVEQAQTERPPSQQFVERFERGYARVIVMVGLLMAVVPPVVLGWDWRTTVYRALIFLVVASPCALVASIMPALLSGIARGARRGILFKNGAQLQALGQIKAVAFDKTGTLTTGQLQVVQIAATAGWSDDQVLQLAASLEVYSEHPIAGAIVRAAQSRGLSLFEASQVQARSGLGITGQIQDHPIVVGKLDLVQELMQTTGLLQRPDVSGPRGTLVWVVQADQILGSITVADTLRPEASPVVQTLKTNLKIDHLIMLTGDNQRTGQQVAQELGIEEVYTNLLPEDKLTVLRQLQHRYQTVAMVGDGINDAPALALADVGIAIGGISSDVALETADIILMGERLDRLPEALQLGRRANRVVRQNITIALTFIVLLLAANLIGQLTLPVGVLGHEGSTLLVILSGLRLLK